MEVLLSSLVASPAQTFAGRRSLQNSARVDLSASITERWNELPQEGADDLDLLFQRDDLQGREVQEEATRVSPKGL